MKKRKIFFLLLTIVLFFVSCSTIMTKEQDPVTIPVQIDEQSGKTNADGSTTYNVLNFDEITVFYGIDNPKSVLVTKFNYQKEDISSTDSESRATYYLDNITGPYLACGTDTIVKVSAANNLDKTITKIITLTGTISNTYSQKLDEGVKIDVVKISAAVGFDVTKSWSISDSTGAELEPTEVDLEPGEIVTVTAMPLYDVYSYDVMKTRLFQDPIKVGYGTAYETVGFCTIVE